MVDEGNKIRISSEEGGNYVRQDVGIVTYIERENEKIIELKIKHSLSGKIITYDRNQLKSKFFYKVLSKSGQGSKEQRIDFSKERELRIKNLVISYYSSFY
ncbi:MAG: hypothetical protein ACPG5P_05930, partial [Saprospiraceae bacterium]